MPRAAAAGGLAFVALFLSDGSSQSRLFWIGAAAIVVAAVGWAVRPPSLPPAALALLGGVALRRLSYAAAALLGALFLWALAAKVIHGLYGDYGRLARLRYPVGYWNELALLAAASVPIGLWLLHRLRIVGALLLYGGLVVAVLTYSRVGIVLAVLAAVVSVALDGRRLEAGRAPPPPP